MTFELEVWGVWEVLTIESRLGPALVGVKIVLSLSWLISSFSMCASDDGSLFNSEGTRLRSGVGSRGGASKALV